jgi:hypothetical protein
MKSFAEMSFEELSLTIQESSFMSKNEADARAIAIRGLISRAWEMYLEAVEGSRRKAAGPSKSAQSPLPLLQEVA